jgi:hypothetical protein
MTSLRSYERMSGTPYLERLGETVSRNLYSKGLSISTEYGCMTVMLPYSVEVDRPLEYKFLRRPNGGG